MIGFHTTQAQVQPIYMTALNNANCCLESEGGMQMVDVRSLEQIDNWLDMSLQV